uniref:Uncharacterized protein n=1 Tax=Pipistrellus kuhlii TaxID=59472 RepID=A0A7J7SFV3_PIPKU|nr:hypothetical protein mPipKuh1_009972 [Pipistrellus kuhlii]
MLTPNHALPGEGVPLCESHGSYTWDVACFSCLVDAETSEVHAGSGSPAPQCRPLRVNPAGRQPRPRAADLPAGPNKGTFWKAGLSPQPPPSTVCPAPWALPRLQRGAKENWAPAPEITRDPRLWDPRLCPADAGPPHYDNQSVFPPQTKKAPSEEPWSPAAPSLASAASSLTRSKPRPVFIRGKGRKVQGD